jgi:hypothetical protein
MLHLMKRSTPIKPAPRARVANSAPLLALFLVTFALAYPLRARPDDAARMHWKQVDDAQVKLDDKVPLAWTVFQLDKKKQPNLVLILLGRRYILLDSKARLAYQVFPTDLQKLGSDFDSDNLVQNPRLIPSTNWTVRDIGPAEQIKLTLQDYGRIVSVDLPHPLDIRLGIY